MFAQARAATIAATRIPALPDSVRRNARNGAVTCLVVHGVRSEASSVTRGFCLIVWHDTARPRKLIQHS
jgi:hypothetical protein